MGLIELRKEHDNQEEHECTKYELTVNIKRWDKIQKKLVNTGQKKTICTDSVSEIVNFWHTYGEGSKPQRKRKKTSPKHLPKGDEAKKILEDVNKNAQEEADKRNNS